MVVDVGEAIDSVVFWSARAGSVSSVPVRVLITGEDIDDVTFEGGKVGSVPVRVLLTGEDIEDVVLDTTKSGADSSWILVGIRVVDVGEMVELENVVIPGLACVGVAVCDDGIGVVLVGEMVELENVVTPRLACVTVAVCDDGVSVVLVGEMVDILDEYESIIGIINKEQRQIIAKICQLIFENFETILVKSWCCNLTEESLSRYPKIINRINSDKSYRRNTPLCKFSS